MTECNPKRLTKKPLIHSSIIDGLPENHPLAYSGESVFCDNCNKMLNDFQNELMDNWLETELGNFCIECLKLENLDECLQGSLGICHHRDRIKCQLFYEQKPTEKKEKTMKVKFKIGDEVFFIIEPAIYKGKIIGIMDAIYCAKSKQDKIWEYIILDSNSNKVHDLIINIFKTQKKAMKFLRKIGMKNE